MRCISARAKAERRRSLDLGRRSARPERGGAGEPLRLVELGDGGLALGAVALDVGALLGRVLLRPRRRAGRGGRWPRRAAAASSSTISRRLCQSGSISWRRRCRSASLRSRPERRVLLVELELERVELAAHRPRLVASFERRRLGACRAGAPARRAAPRAGRPGPCAAARTEKCPARSEPQENAAHGLPRLIARSVSRPRRYRQRAAI